MPVLMSAEQFQTGTHRSSARFRKEGASMFGVEAAKSRWHQHFDPLIEQFQSIITNIVPFAFLYANLRENQHRGAAGSKVKNRKLLEALRVFGPQAKEFLTAAVVGHCIEPTMRPARIKHALARTYADLLENHTLQMAAALAYYFVLSFFPALIFLSAVVAYLPVPDLFNQALNVMARFLPADSMGLVRRVLSDVITPNRGTFLSFGILGTLWAASGGFAATIEALNIAYEVKDDRPFWKTRPLAVGLALLTGALMLVALAVMIVGPSFGAWLAARIHLSYLFVLVWPYIHWSIAVGFTIIAVEALYFLAPNVKQRFLATLPGAVLAVGCWIALSCLLGFYFRQFANFNKTYGTLGAAIALMTWLYWTGFALLVGAELNAELAKISSEGKIEEKHEPPRITKIDLAT